MTAEVTLVTLCKSPRARRVFLCATMGVVAALSVGYWLRPRNQEDVISAAYSFPNGGGYAALGDTGSPVPIIQKGITVLGGSKHGSYCCGFTFAVAMKVAQQRGLLEGMEPYELKNFQHEWYGATSDSALKQVAVAVRNHRLGREIAPADAQRGDFVAFRRPGSSGHSVIFLDWVRANGVIVGFRYRSSQPTTHGIGDATEYFTTSGYRGATIDPQQMFVARLGFASW